MPTSQNRSTRANKDRNALACDNRLIFLPGTNRVPQ